MSFSEAKMESEGFFFALLFPLATTKSKFQKKKRKEKKKKRKKEEEINKEKSKRRWRKNWRSSIVLWEEYSVPLHTIKRTPSQEQIH